ncbi:MAG: hypothetical protein A2351_01350 [Omnitrophica bacterium RIFOXYB12_FULL_50_7]|nr:MAG: hypothetical protein A2351_01350 [Omnitrophica bacterium RIFOXYB12_FULL_50_7]
MKDNIVIAAIVAVALIVSSVFIKGGMEHAAKATSPAVYSLSGYEGVLYRLNNVNGRIDVLVPSNEAALLFPVSQIQLPGAKDKLTTEQQKSLTQNVKMISQYIQGERARSLGLGSQAVK